MVPVSVTEFLEACGGKLLAGNAEGVITSATSDSRTVENGSVFFAIWHIIMGKNINEYPLIKWIFVF